MCVALRVQAESLGRPPIRSSDLQTRVASTQRKDHSNPKGSVWLVLVVMELLILRGSWTDDHAPETNDLGLNVAQDTASDLEYRGKHPPELSSERHLSLCSRL